MPDRPHLIRRIVGAAAPVMVLATSCGGFGDVDVDPFTVEDGTGSVCADVLDALPEVVDDAVRREVSPADLPAAAWGQPAIVLRCGVPMPADYEPDAQLFDIDGLGWLPVEADGGTVFTSVDRDVRVEMAIPDDYDPPAEVLTDLSQVLLDHLPERRLP